ADVAPGMAFLERVVEQSNGSPLLYVPCGSGFLFEYRIPRLTRNVCFWAPELIRPYERQSFLRALERTDVIVTCDWIGEPNQPIEKLLPVDSSIAHQVYDRLELRTTEAGCRVWHVRR